MYDYTIWFLRVLQWASLLGAALCLLPLLIGLICYFLICYPEGDLFNRNRFSIWSYYNFRLLYRAYWEMRTLIMSITYGWWNNFRKLLFYPFLHILVAIIFWYLFGLWLYLDCGTGGCFPL